MQGVAARLETLSQQGIIWASDSNVICDGLLTAAACDLSVHLKARPLPQGVVLAAGRPNTCNH